MAHKQSNFNLILLGDPASGKATQGKFLAKKFGLFDLDMGRILREIKEGSHHSKFSKTLIATMDKGKLAPTKIVRQLLEENIKGAPNGRGIILNGTPKMLGEAKLVDGWLKKHRGARTPTFVIYLHLTKAESLKRMLGRRRADDTRVALENRIKYYRKNIADVVDFFKQRYSFKMVSGEGTRSEVRAEILKDLNELINKKQ